MPEKETAGNPMRKIFIDKVVINIGTGSEAPAQLNAKRLLEIISGEKPADEISRKRNPAFKITKGQKIGAFVTLRRGKAVDIAKRLFDAVDNKVRERSITNNSLSFGINEYIDISGVKYDPKIGMLGMNVSMSFRRPGMRVALRKRRRAYVSRSHSVIAPDEIKGFLEGKFNVSFV
jgi:large subunit ribosomal protein L5